MIKFKLKKKKKKSSLTFFHVHRNSVLAGLSVVSQLMFGDQVASIKRAGF